MGAVVLAATSFIAIAGGADASTADQSAGVAARGVSKPTFSPKSGPVGTNVKVKGKCGKIGLGKVRSAVVGFYYKDAFSWTSGYSTFHEVTIKGAKAADYAATLKVKPAHKYTPGEGAMPKPDVLRKPKAGDKIFVQTLCYYADSAYPQYKSAKGKFSVTKKG